MLNSHGNIFKFRLVKNVKNYVNQVFFYICSLGRPKCMFKPKKANSVQPWVRNILRYEERALS